MSARTLLSYPHRGDTVLVQISEHGGKTFANFRKWYSDGNSLKPTRQGVTIPLEALPDLYAALGAYLADMAPAGLKTP
ncbi:transcriptional coactivator p15/PC4 family protein [Sphingorhabdus sp.]|uniref:transcriptional coactivator p15/PC4 family protein n=1 Tax=Sphingorhabdus sp. TaxID=1902408 RepID=UPI0037C755C1